MSVIIYSLLLRKKMTNKYKIPSSNIGKMAGLAQFIFLCGAAVFGFLVITHPISWPIDAYYRLFGLCMACLIGVVAVQLLLKGRFLDIRGVKAGWESGDQWISPVRISRRILRMHRAAFPAPLKQRGSAGRNLTAARAQGRGQAARRPAGSGQKKKTADSDGDGGGDGEPIQSTTPDVPPTNPQYSHRCAASVGPFLSFRDLARRWSCAEKTLRNKTCVGKLPRPVQLPVGPRWPIEIIEAIEAGDWFPPIASNVDESIVLTKYGRGRSRVVRDRGDS
jgi:hypothetical protein